MKRLICSIRRPGARLTAVARLAASLTAGPAGSADARSKAAGGYARCTSGGARVLAGNDKVLVVRRPRGHTLACVIATGRSRSLGDTILGEGETKITVRRFVLAGSIAAFNWEYSREEVEQGVSVLDLRGHRRVRRYDAVSNVAAPLWRPAPTSTRHRWRLAGPPSTGLPAARRSSDAVWSTRRIPIALAATAALVVAGCAGNSDDGTGTTASITSQVTIPASPKLAWVPRHLRDRVVDLGPHHGQCGVLYNGRRAIQYGLFVSGGARCRPALLVLVAFDAGLSKSDLTPDCDYRLCEPKSRTYRGYRCRLVHQFDDDFEFLCTRGSRKVGFNWTA